jgi:hypothetical protein
LENPHHFDKGVPAELPEGNLAPELAAVVAAQPLVAQELQGILGDCD